MNWKVNLKKFTYNVRQIKVIDNMRDVKIIENELYVVTYMSHVICKTKKW